MRYLLNILVFMAYALSSGSGLILLKMALSEHSINFSTLMKIITNSKFMIGFFLYLVGFILWMYILSRFKLNVAFPIAMALFFIISSIGSYLVLKEPFNILHIFGIILCFLGIVLISLK